MADQNGSGAYLLGVLLAAGKTKPRADGSVGAWVKLDLSNGREAFVSYFDVEQARQAVAGVEAGKALRLKVVPEVYEGKIQYRGDTRTGDGPRVGKVDL